MGQAVAVMVFTTIALGAWALVAQAARLGRRPGAGVFVAMGMALALLATVALVQAVVADPVATDVLVRVQLALRALTPAIWLAALLRWAAPPFVRWPLATIVALVAPSAAFAVAALATPIGGPMLATVERSVATPWVVDIVLGPWVLAASLPYGLAQLALAAAVIVATPLGGRGIGRPARTGWLAATLLALLASLMSVLGVSPTPGFTGTTFALGVMVAVLHATLATSPAFARREVAFRAAFDSMHEPALVVGADGGVLEANPAALRLLGDGSGMQGANLLAIAPQLEILRRRSGAATPRAQLAGNLAGFEASVAIARTGIGMGPATVLVLHDRRAEQAHAAQLLERSRRDPLTGAVNRLGFEAAFAHAVAGAHGRPVALAYVDLDGFKVVNDTLGHAAGDEVLVEVARRLRAIVRDGDVVARLGGDEFAMVLVDVTPQVLADVAERAAVAIRAPIATATGAVEVGASLGLATAPRDGTTLDEVLAAADGRMYRQKHERPERGARTAPSADAGPGAAVVAAGDTAPEHAMGRPGARPPLGA
jgi:diguanylate cyclase (GGDEF)-like protein